MWILLATIAATVKLDTQAETVKQTSTSVHPIHARTEGYVLILLENIAVIVNLDTQGASAKQVKIIVHQINAKMGVHVWILVRATNVIVWLAMMELTVKFKILMNANYEFPGNWCIRTDRRQEPHNINRNITGNG